MSCAVQCARFCMVPSCSLLALISPSLLLLAAGGFCTVRNGVDCKRKVETPRGTSVERAICIGRITGGPIESTGGAGSSNLRDYREGEHGSRNDDDVIRFGNNTHPETVATSNSAQDEASGFHNTRKDEPADIGNNADDEKASSGSNPDDEMLDVGEHQHEETVDMYHGAVQNVVSIGKKSHALAGVGNKMHDDVKACSAYFISQSGTGFQLRSGPQTRFVVFSLPRSGSNFFMAWLNQHHDIESSFEAFHPRNVFAIGWDRNDTHLRDKDRNKFVNMLYDPSNPKYKRHSQSATAFGFKVFPHQLSLEEFRSLAEAHSVKKIILRRGQLLRQFVSRLKARQSQTYIGYNTSGIQVHVNVSDFKAYARQHEGYYDVCLHHAYGRTSLEQRSNWFFTNYQALTRNPVRTVNKIYRFLGVREIAGKVRAPRSVKQDASPLSASIVNYKQVAKALSHTKFGSDL